MSLTYTTASTRPPCGEQVGHPPKMYLGGCFQQYDIGDDNYSGSSGWPRMLNQTKQERITSTDLSGSPLGVYVCPYAVPRCWEQGMLPVTCSTNEPARVVNTYTLANSHSLDCNGVIVNSSSVFFGSCEKIGFKSVMAAKGWCGHYGFDYPCAQDSQPSVKYLSISRTGTRNISSYCCTGDGEGGTVHYPASTNYTKQYNEDTDRFSCNVSSSALDQTDYCLCSVLGPEDCYTDTSSIEPINMPLFGLNACLDADGNILWSGCGLYDEYLNSDTVPCGWTIEKEFSADRLSVSITMGTSDGLCPCLTGSMGECLYDENGCIIRDTSSPLCDCNDNGGPTIDTMTMEVSLSGPYSVDQVNEDCDALLDTWDLEDDVQYPWRTDSPGTDTYGQLPLIVPLVTYASDGTVLGAPLPRGGYDPYWNTQHKNWEPEFILSLNRDCLKNTSWGAYSPFQSATQWLERRAPFLPYGSFASYNAPFYVENDRCTGDELWMGSHLVKTKWAEVLIQRFPSHNYARPCGPIDRATIDPDTINCDTSSMSYSTGSLRWPDAPVSCSGIYASIDGNYWYADDSSSKQDYCVKSWQYNYSQSQPLVSMTCLQTCAEFSACGKAVFIQPTPTKKSSSIWIPSPSLSTFDEQHGSLALTLINQVMPDPLWKRPRVPCDAEIEDEPDPYAGQEDPNALVPWEECRDCASGNCDNYVQHLNTGGAAKTACEPNNQAPWALDTIEEVDP
jgi:hypothetical protein